MKALDLIITVGREKIKHNVKVRVGESGANGRERGTKMETPETHSSRIRHSVAE